ncbi:winged helix-turn-helix transcriptional regulator [Embleya hyalina]|uniref:Transcriptional regulator n=1 Tax=Embleya hyalina TaxID=516124 RepID=A0A401YUF5_9ACTN|nr:helix-turn-helix domain-containing protein [Embleya hyalina]GCD98268.1 transcriptional regulator [Embleya hyalina]
MHTPPDLRPFGGADVYLGDCASRAVLDLIANKWVALVVGALHPQTLRYAELRRRLGGITKKMLTQTLRDLERHGLVRRTVHPTVPPQVEYSLTELGISVSGLMAEIRTWSESHIDEIAAAKLAYAEAEAHRVAAL